MEQLSALHQQGCKTQQVCGHYQQHMSNLAMHHCIIASILPMNSATQDFLDILSISKGWSVLLTEQMPLHCPHRSRVASNENRKCQKNWQKNDYMDENWQTTFVWPKNYLKTRFKLLSLAKMGLVSGCVINIKVSTWHFPKIHRFPTRFPPNPFGNPKVVTISRVFQGVFHPPNNQQIARFRTTDRMKKESRCTMAMACVRSRNSWIHILAAIVVFQWEVDVYT